MQPDDPNFLRVLNQMRAGAEARRDALLVHLLEMAELHVAQAYQADGEAPRPPHGAAHAAAAE